MVEKKVSEILASRTQSAPEQPDISEAVQKRLDALERRIDDGRHDDTKSEGLRFLLMARQHKERGEDASALKMYEMAQPFFPGQTKLQAKIDRLREKMAAKREGQELSASAVGDSAADSADTSVERKKKAHRQANDEDYEAAEADDDDESFMRSQKKSKKVKATRIQLTLDDTPLTPHMQELLDIINSRDATAIMGLQGFGPKKARDLVDYLGLMTEEDGGRIDSLAQLRAVPGMGGRAVERAYDGLVSGRA
jgi:DNA uptake protein ComE-like DNA-binding protein